MKENSYYHAASIGTPVVGEKQMNIPAHQPKLIHVAVGSTMSIPGDVDGNLRQIQQFTEQARRDDVDLLLTPEMSVSGYGPYPEIQATAEVAGEGPIYRALAGMANEAKIVLCAGFVESCAPKRHLSHYVVYPDGHFVVQRKHRVTPAERPLDALVRLSPATEEDPIGQPLEPLDFTFFEVNGVRCALTICADSGIPGLNEYLAEHGIELLLGPAGAGGRREDRVVTADLYTEEGLQKYEYWLERVFFPGRGAVTACLKYAHAAAAVNQCGFDGKAMYHLGHGMIMTPMGEIAALIHGLPNLDRQRPLYTHAVVDVADRLYHPTEAATRRAVAAQS